MENNNDFEINHNSNVSTNYMTSHEVEKFVTDILIDIKDLKERVRNMESIVFNNYNTDKPV